MMDLSRSPRLQAIVDGLNGNLPVANATHVVGLALIIIVVMTYDIKMALGTDAAIAFGTLMGVLSCLTALVGVSHWSDNRAADRAAGDDGDSPKEPK